MMDILEKTKFFGPRQLCEVETPSTVKDQNGGLHALVRIKVEWHVLAPLP